MRKANKSKTQAYSVPLIALDTIQELSQEMPDLYEQKQEISVSFEEYRTEWLESIKADSPSSFELGKRFGTKLITQWLDIDNALDDEELYFCDGSKDGGIDIAYLLRGESRISDRESRISENDNQINNKKSPEGDTWYLVQSKYGTAFRGVTSLITEGRKVIETLEGQRKHLASLVDGLLEQLTLFRDRAGELDRIVLVFATEDTLTEDQKKALEDVQVLGRTRLGPLFDVDAISIRTIYQRVLGKSNEMLDHVKVSIRGQLHASGNGLLVGTVSLIDLYEFLQNYMQQTGDLNLLYEKNVRRSLGSRTRVNGAMRQTLKETPDQFGLYNNGITIVVTDFKQETEDFMLLSKPYVVNGCQTTQMVWEACRSQLKSGGTGRSEAFEKWRQAAEKGVIITKIVMVGPTGADLEKIARFTNSQNAIREQDFLALEHDVNKWAKEAITKYHLYVETQRGEWESVQTRQKDPRQTQFKDHANAFDLLKVYGAGWLGLPGVAFGDNAPFVPPSGWVYKQILQENKDRGDAFGADDLYVTYRLKLFADIEGFGRKGDETKNSRKQTRFLFYMVVIELLKHALNLAAIDPTPRNLTQAFLKFFKREEDEATIKAMIRVGTSVIDEYLQQGGEESVFTEPAFSGQFSNNLGGYLKWNNLGRAETEKNSPNLHRLLSAYKRAMSVSSGEQNSLMDRLLKVIKS